MDEIRGQRVGFHPHEFSGLHRLIEGLSDKRSSYKHKNKESVMTKEKIGLLLIVAALVTNPLTGSYIQLAIELAFSQLFLVGPWVRIIRGVYM